MKEFALSVLIIAAVVACKKKDISKTPELTGKWVWVERSGGFSGGTEKNKPLNTNQFIEFTADNYKDCQSGTCFEFKYEAIGDSLKFKNASGDKVDHKMFSFKHDTLIINDGCCDRYITHFVKIN